MALPTALAFLLLSISLLLSGPFAGMFALGQMPHDQTSRDRIFRRCLLIIAALTVGIIVSAAYFYVRNAQQSTRESTWRELDAVADLKVAQLVQWRQERLGEGLFLQRTPAVVRDVAAMLASPEDAAARARVKDWLEPIRGGDRYASVMVFDAAGTLRLTVPDHGLLRPLLPGDLLARALQEPTVHMSELQRVPGKSTMQVSIVAPLLLGPETAGMAVKETNGVFGVIVLWLDAGQALFPMLQKWPVPSATAEIVLVRREGESVVFLNELRHRPGDAPGLKHSVAEPLLPAAMAARGQPGVREGLDYRGEPVLTAIRSVPSTTWYLLAKIDQHEAYAAMRREFLQSGLLMLFVLVVIGLATISVWRQRHTAHLQRLLAAEQARKTAAERLSLVMRHANDIIFLLDETGRIVEASERAFKAYGYTLEEFCALPPGGLRDTPNQAELAGQMQGFLSPEGISFQTTHRRKDGTTFPVEVSGRAVEDGGRQLILGIYRDISERLAHEREMERFNHLYDALSQVNQAIVHARERDELLGEICRVLVEHGRFQMAWIGWHDPATSEVRVVAERGDTAGYLKGIHIYADARPEGRGPTGTAIREKRTVVCNDILDDAHMRVWREAASHSGFLSSVALPVLQGKECQWVLNVYATERGFFGQQEIALLEEAAMDVGFGLENIEREFQRRNVELALQTSEERFRTVFDHAPVGISLTSEEGIVLVNAEHARITGVPIADSNVPGVFARVSHPADYARQRAAAEKFHRDEVGSYTVEKRYLHPDGRVQWAELTSRFYRDPATKKRIILTIITDIAARKEAEARQQQQLEELQRWQAVTIGRETRIMELKREVNALLVRAGEPSRYTSVEVEKKPDTPGGPA
jgi:PAS domain S-box-containing protein